MLSLIFIDNTTKNSPQFVDCEAHVYKHIYEHIYSHVHTFTNVCVQLDEWYQLSIEDGMHMIEP